MRVLFASYTSDTTGPTNSLLLLLKYLRRVHDVRVLMPGNGPLAEELERQGVRYRAVPSLDSRSVSTLVPVLRHEKVELLYLNNTCGAMRNVAIAGLLARIPYVCHVREMGHEKTWKQLGYLWPAAAVVAVSESCGASVKRFVRRGRLHVVHNGVDLSGPDAFPPPSREVARRAYGLPEDAVVILSVAHVSSRKGQEYAIAAMADIVRDWPHAHLCFVGQHREEEYVRLLSQQINERGLTANVHFLGFRRDLRSLYAGADIFVHTALADPHPRSVIEAMRAGLPVVGFATDGVSETVADGVTGFLVGQRDAAALARALDRLISNPDMGAAMGAAGSQRVVERFSAERSAAQVDEIIRSIRHRPVRAASARMRADLPSINR